MLIFSLNILKHFSKTKWVSNFVFVSNSPYSATRISWFHFKKYSTLVLLNSNTSKWSHCTAYFFILSKSFFKQRDLLPEYKNQKKSRHSTSHVTVIKFQVFILRKKRIFIAFFWIFTSICYDCFMWYLEFYWPSHNFETNANLVMTFSPKIETYRNLSGVKFRNHWCLVSYFTDQKKENALWSVNYISLTWPTQKLLLVDFCSYLTLRNVLRSSKLENVFFSNFSNLWRHFCLVSEMHKWKEIWWHIFFESFFFPNIKTLWF